MYKLWVDKVDENGYINTLEYDDEIKAYGTLAGPEGYFIHHWFMPNFMVFKKDN